MKIKMIDVVTNKQTSARPKRKRKNIVIVCEELDHTWDESEIKHFCKLWKEDISIWEMEEIFQRPQAEIALVIIDQEIKGNIQPRKMGLGVIGNEKCSGK